MATLSGSGWTSHTLGTLNSGIAALGRRSLADALGVYGGFSGLADALSAINDGEFQAAADELEKEEVTDEDGEVVLDEDGNVVEEINPASRENKEIVAPDIHGTFTRLIKNLTDWAGITGKSVNQQPTRGGDAWFVPNYSAVRQASIDTACGSCTGSLETNDGEPYVVDPYSFAEGGAFQIIAHADVLAIPHLHLSFDREALNEQYRDLHKEDNKSTTTGGAAVLKQQIDYTAAAERAYRLRHATPIRSTLHHSIRREAHGHEVGVFQRVLMWVQDNLKASTPSDAITAAASQAASAAAVGSGAVAPDYDGDIVAAIDSFLTKGENSEIEQEAAIEQRRHELRAKRAAGGLSGYESQAITAELAQIEQDRLARNREPFSIDPVAARDFIQQNNMQDHVAFSEAQGAFLFIGEDLDTRPYLGGEEQLLIDAQKIIDRFDSRPNGPGDRGTANLLQEGMRYYDSADTDHRGNQSHYVKDTHGVFKRRELTLDEAKAIAKQLVKFRNGPGTPLGNLLGSLRYTETRDLPAIAAGCAYGGPGGDFKVHSSGAMIQAGCHGRTRLANGKWRDTNLPEDEWYEARVWTYHNSPDAFSGGTWLASGMKNPYTNPTTIGWEHKGFGPSILEQQAIYKLATAELSHPMSGLPPSLVARSLGGTYSKGSSSYEFSKIRRERTAELHAELRQAKYDAWAKVNGKYHSNQAARGLSDGGTPSFDRRGRELLSEAEHIEKIDAAYRAFKARADLVGVVDDGNTSSLAIYVLGLGLGTSVPGMDTSGYLQTDSMRGSPIRYSDGTLVNPPILPISLGGTPDYRDQYVENWH
jgi:hypothetical protein